MITALRSCVRAHPRLVVAAVLLVVLGSVVMLRNEAQSRTFHAHFTEVKGLYVGDSVDMLGVRVGKVTEIDPQPTRVRVTFEVDRGQKIPAGAKAVLVSPSLVSVRHLALSPVYSGGPVLEDGAVIPISRTAVPVEWDDVKDQLLRLTKALGPRGANKRGALSNLVEVSADNLDGQGANLRGTIEALTEAAATLADSGGDIFATVRNLEIFVSALEASEDIVGDFNTSLVSVSKLLAEDGKDLTAMMRALDSAFTTVSTFVEENRGGVKSTVEGLSRASSMLARNRQKLADILQVVPGTVTNFYNIYDPQVPGLTGSFTLPNLDSPAMFLCSAVYSLGGTPDQCEDLLEPIAKYLKLPLPPIAIGAPTTPGVSGKVRSTSPSVSPDQIPGMLDLLELLDRMRAAR